MRKATPVRSSALCVVLALVCGFVCLAWGSSNVFALSVVPGVSNAAFNGRILVKPPCKVRNSVARTGSKSMKRRGAKVVPCSKESRPCAKRKAVRVPAPQNLVGCLKGKIIYPGVVHKTYRGLLSINVIDVDMVNASTVVRPVLAAHVGNRLSGVNNQARQMRALAAVNANYFKKDGTPLGTLILNREWVAGPLYNRVSMGITHCGFVRVDRVNLHGIAETSNPAVSRIWVNNVNQPRRTGSKLIAYTRHWGSCIRMAYAGCLVAVNSNGVVADTGVREMGIPWGGYVLSDRKDSAISYLQKGDQVKLSWQTTPDTWRDVVSAVSGGPLLIKEGKLFVDLQGESFGKAWAGRHITARTGAGVTWDNHLLLVTVEGPHTLWDLAKLMDKLGAADALNLDGGGSTTMVVNGRTVTRNANSCQRCVANSLAVFATSPAISSPVISPVVSLSRDSLADTP
ncbi:MAG: phosphodiester glycosidase family protein [Candidatus Melainabacteria bacterium]|nr:phosphodiester glycosidase family protein [Candidatus Melainabacteria bacterium]